MKFRFLQPTAEEPDRLLDISQWNSLLRSVAGYHAFRRIHPRGIRPADVASFLLVDADFPRSIGLCVEQVALLTRDLNERYDLTLDADIERTLLDLRYALRDQPIEAIVRGDMYGFIDNVQLLIAAFTGHLGRAFFGNT